MASQSHSNDKSYNDERNQGSNNNNQGGNDNGGKYDASNDNNCKNVC